MSVNKNADDYANARIGIYFPGFPADYTGQCTSLVKWFLGEMCNVADWQAARGNARDFGDTLVRQGLARVIDISERQRGDIVVWKQDGGGFGHIGVLCSGDNVFEENVGLKGVPSAVYGGNTVHPSRLDALGASWRTGGATFYRPSGYSEVVNATREQVIQAYIDILERDPTNVDEGGIAHYQNYPNDVVRQNLLDSQERKDLLAHKDAVAAAQAAADALAASQAQAIVDAQAKADAKAKADADTATQAALDAKAATVLTQPPIYVPEVPVLPVQTTPTPSSPQTPVTRPPVQSIPVSIADLSLLARIFVYILKFLRITK